MSPGYIETPYNFTDKHWYTSEGEPRTIRTNAPGSIASHPSSSSTTPSFKTNPVDKKDVDEAYRSLPSLGYEYKKMPAPVPARIDVFLAHGNSASRPGVRQRAKDRDAERARARLTNTNSNSYAIDQENIIPSSVSSANAHREQHSHQHHRAHATPAYTPATKRQAPKVQCAPVVSHNEGAINLAPGASWYRAPAPSSASNGAENAPVSWYRPRPDNKSTSRKGPVKGRGARGSVIANSNARRASLIVATQAQRPEGTVKTWYAGVRRKLFRAGPKATERA